MRPARVSLAETSDSPPPPHLVLTLGLSHTCQDSLAPSPKGTHKILVLVCTWGGSSVGQWAPVGSAFFKLLDEAGNADLQNLTGCVTLDKLRVPTCQCPHL